MLKKIYHNCLKKAFRKLFCKDKTTTNCTQQITKKIEHITSEVIEEVIEKITFFTKLIRFSTTFVFTFLRLLLFIFRFFVYPITVLTLFASFLIVYISLKPDQNLTNVIHGFIFTHNLFVKEKFIAPTIKITKDPNKNLIYIDFDTIKIGEQFSIKNLRISINIFHLLINKALNITIPYGKIYIKLDNSKQTNPYTTINEIAKFIDSTLTRFLPLKSNSFFNLDINIASLDGDQKYNTSFNLQLKLQQEGVITQENTMSLSIQNFKSNFVEISNNNQDLKIKCTKELFSFVCNLKIPSSNINIKNIASFKNLSLLLILEKSIKYQTYNILYNIDILNTSLNKNQITNNTSINNIKIIGDLTKLNISGHIPNSINVNGEINFSNHLSSQTIKGISSKIKNIIRKNFSSKPIINDQCSPFANYAINLFLPKEQNNKDGAINTIKIFNLKPLAEVQNNLQNNLTSINLNNTTITGSLGKNCLNDLNVKANIASLQYQDLSNQNSKPQFTANDIGVEFYKNKLLFNFNDPFLLNINNSSNNLQSLTIQKNSNIAINLESSGDVIIDINFKGLISNLLKYFSFLDNKILLDLAKNKVSQGSVKIQMPFSDPSNLQMLINLRFDKFYSYFVEATQGLSIAIVKQKNQNEYLILSNSLNKHQNITTLGFASTNYSLLGRILINEQNQQITSTFHAFDDTHKILKPIDFLNFDIDNKNKLQRINYNNLHEQTFNIDKFITVDILSSPNGIKNITTTANTNENKFNFKYNKISNEINLTGDLLNLALPFTLYYNQNNVFSSESQQNKDLQNNNMQNLHQTTNIFDKIASFTMPNIAIDIKNINLLNSISTPLHVKIDNNIQGNANTDAINFANINNIVVNSSLFDINYKASQPQKNDNILIINVPSLQKFFTALNISFGNFKITKGSLNIVGNLQSIKNQQIINVTHNINNISIESDDKSIKNINGKFNSITYLKPSENINEVLIDSEKKVEIRDIKFSNSLHTVFGKGLINLADLTIDAKLSYSPTILYQAQHTPIIGQVLDAVSLYRDEGFSSVSYTITGNMFSPQVKFGSVSFLMFKIGRIGK